MKSRFFFLVATVALCCGEVSVFGQGLSSSTTPSPVVPAMLSAGYSPQAELIPTFAPPSAVALVGHHEAKCDGKACGGKCAACCGSPLSWCRHMAFYGEFLYLRARDAEVAYAVPFDGPIVPQLNTIQVGPVGVADMDFQPSFRAGMTYYFNECSRLNVEYTMFESGTTDFVSTQAPTVIRSLVAHPGTRSAAQDFLQAQAQYDISFDLLDIDFERLMYWDDAYHLSWVVGVRLAQHEQVLETDFAGTGTERVATDIDFDGIGVRFGLNGEAALNCHWLVYANLMGNIVPGEFTADYDQSQSYDPRVVDTSWKAGRIITMWDFELGVARVSTCRNYRISAGYLFSAWTNMVETDEWIDAVKANNFVDMSSTMTFDGLVARFEARF